MNQRATDLYTAPNWDFPFSRPVCLQIQADTVVIENVKQAMACLHCCFPDQTGSSLLRAIATCTLAMTGKVSPDDARATLIVAAMEAGFPFDESGGAKVGHGNGAIVSP